MDNFLKVDIVGSGILCVIMPGLLLKCNNTCELFA